ncbi:MAG TPA: hypothetical protein VE913_21370, partial [Longimicrobium sp.]|nr:hypothetical protein [Longimicrobium sp.]
MQRRSVLHLALALGILIGAGGCAEAGLVASAPEASVFQPLVRSSDAALFDRVGNGNSGRAEALIGPEGGELTTDGGFRLRVPEGAVAEPTLMSLRELPGLVGVDLAPYGLEFTAGTQPTLTIPLTGVNTAAYRSLTIASIERGRIVEILATAVTTTAMTT